MASLYVFKIAFCGLFTNLPVALLDKVLDPMLVPRSKEMPPKCLPQPICVKRPNQTLCRAKGYYWDIYSGTIPPNADDVRDEGSKYDAPLYAAQYYSATQLHVTTISVDGKVRYVDETNVVSPVKILRLVPPYIELDFFYTVTWPGTMTSNIYRGEPDVREAAVVVGVERGRLVYFGKVRSSESYYGKIAFDETSQKYELIYYDDNNDEQHTEEFWVSIWRDCKDIFESQGFLNQ